MNFSNAAIGSRAINYSDKFLNFDYNFAYIRLQFCLYSEEADYKIAYI